MPLSIIFSVTSTLPNNSTLPNLVFLLTDDQDLLLGSLEAMPAARRLLGDGGTTFTNFFAHTPVCCPSRGQLLTGRYMHNLKAANASVATCMRLDVRGETADEAFSAMTVAPALKRAGYTTLMSGKYLNGMEVSHCPDPENASSFVAPPPGWDRYLAMCPDTCYTDCFFSDDGYGRTYNDTSFPAGSNYAPSVIGNATLQFVRGALRQRTPFFAYVAPHSPHSPATPAPWYSDAFGGHRAPRTASYNVSAPDHHWEVAVQPLLTMEVADSMDALARARLQTLLSVDDILIELFALLGQTEFNGGVQRGGVQRGTRGALDNTYVKPLDNTYVMLTSDHGFHMGQFCLGPCKRQPYDTDLRVPFLVRGPGVPAGGTVTQEGVKEDKFGHILDSGNGTFRGLRRINAHGEDLAYFEFTDPYADWAFQHPAFIELYNLSADPEQLVNAYDAASVATRQELAQRLRAMYACVGSGCE